MAEEGEDLRSFTSIMDALVRISGNVNHHTPNIMEKLPGKTSVPYNGEQQDNILSDQHILPPIMRVSQEAQTNMCNIEEEQEDNFIQSFPRGRKLLPPIERHSRATQTEFERFTSNTDGHDTPYRFCSGTCLNKTNKFLHVETQAAYFGLSFEEWQTGSHFSFTLRKDDELPHFSRTTEGKREKLPPILAGARKNTRKKKNKQRI